MSDEEAESCCEAHKVIAAIEEAHRWSGNARVGLAVTPRSDTSAILVDAGVDTAQAWEIAGKILTRLADDVSEFWDEQQVLRMDGKYLSRYDEGFLDALDIYEQRVRGE